MSSIPRAWVRLLRAHAQLTRVMDARLREAHDLSLREYEVLLAIDDSADGRARRVDLADKLLLTQGGVTRILGPLERAGLVASVPSDADRRVTFATLTPEGRAQLRTAQRTHRRDVAQLFGSRFDAAELEILDGLLARLPGAAGDEDWGSPRSPQSRG